MIERFLRNFNTRELLRFLVAGTSSVFVDCISYWMLVHLGLNVSASKFLSFITGSLVGFVVNKLWTFESKGKLTLEVLRYILLYTTTIMLNVISNKIVLEFTGLWWFAFLFATGVSTIVNFLGLKFFVFRKELVK